jgi:hypothetical protein
MLDDIEKRAGPCIIGWSDCKDFEWRLTNDMTAPRSCPRLKTLDFSAS